MTLSLYSAEDFEEYFWLNQEKYQVIYDPFEGSWEERHGDTAGMSTLFKCLEWSLRRVGKAKASITDVMAECLEHGYSSGGNEDDSSDWFIGFPDYSKHPDDGGAA